MKIRLAYRLGLAAALFFVLGALVLVGALGWMIHHHVHDDSRDRAALIAWRHADVVGRHLNGAQNLARTLALTLQRLSAVNQGRPDRDQALNVMRGLLGANPALAGVRLVFEPDWLEDDAAHQGKPGHDKNGRFMPHWTRDEEGELALRPLRGLEDAQLGRWYQSTLQRKAPTVSGPTLFLTGSGTREWVTLGVPIVNAQEAVIGAVGVDVALHEILSQLAAVPGIPFESAYLGVYDGEARFIAGLAGEQPDRDWEISDDYAALQEDFLNGQAGFRRRRIADFGGNVWTFHVPVPILGSDHYWTVAYNYTEDFPWRQAMSIMIWPLLLGGLVTALLGLAFTVYVYYTALPLRRVTERLQALSRGELENSVIHYRDRDEIADIIAATGVLQRGMGDTIAQANAIAGGDYAREIQMLSDQDQLGRALANMTQKLREITTNGQHLDWLKTGETQLNAAMSGEEHLQPLCRKIIHFLCGYLHAQVGMLYVLDESARMVRLQAAYAMKHREHIQADFKIGEGVPGQAALEQEPIIIHRLPRNYLTVRSGLGKQAPQCLMLYPFAAENQLKGVIELAFLQPVSEAQEELMALLAPTIGIAINAVQSRARMAALLRQRAD